MLSALARRARRSPELVRWLTSSPTRSRDAWLAARMLAWALIVPILKHVLSLPTLARLAWKRCPGGARDAERERRVVRLADMLARGTNVSSRRACLQRSVLAYRFLAELGADPLLCVAFRNDRREVEGHAWVVVDGRPIGDWDGGVDGFTPLVAFGAHGRMVPQPQGEERR